MRKDCFKRVDQFKEALLQLRGEREKRRTKGKKKGREKGGREIKAFLECRKVMLSYTIHELNRTVLI